MVKAATCYKLPELMRPEAPTLRVLESLMPPPGSLPGAAALAAGARGRNRAQLVEVVDGEEAFELDADDDEFLVKAPVKKRGGKRKVKVTAEMKRKAAAERKRGREEDARANMRDKEEIFEVGDEGMMLEDLADALQEEPSELVRALFMKGITLSMNQVLDKNTCKLVAAEFDVVCVDKEEAKMGAAAAKTTEFNTDADIDELVPRPPVVTVMGHVDHGKTSLLDYIRKARVANGEAGGITQGIGAYNTSVEVDGEQRTICFLDTPGHEAFSAMRARGAKVTDVAIIIVAADDGVRPQTREAVSHAQAAGVPIVVAINKIDKPGADIERVKQELLELELVPEEWGGTTPMVSVSAKKGTGVAELLMTVCYLAEEQSLSANPNKAAVGTVIEAHLDRRKGPVASLLVQAGTLRVGDVVQAGSTYGKVRSMSNDLGETIFEAGPSIALQLSGLDSVPDAGEEFKVYATEADAREAAASSILRNRSQRLSDMSSGGSMVTLSSLASLDEDTEAMQKLNLVIKADTIGVTQAIKSALSALPQESVTLRYLLMGAGDITMSDVDLAAASEALLVGFNLEPSEAVAVHAKRLGVTVMTYKVIYNIVDDIKAAMEGKLRAVEEKVPLGIAEVKAVFGSGKRKVAGCVVITGRVQKGARVTVTRGKRVMHEGELTSLRRNKDAVDEVSEGTECGLGCDGFLQWEEGDKLEVYLMVSKTRRLEEAKADTAVALSSLM
ncbi:hypothetical protein FOA52_000066 [Chlamydomonas sp. UWO 241]|nr:hypothetical protein FOA52_000066 [Chlamydomonas sp. UWO 241]